jgi:Mg/Co/Ni transporter MgtE
MESPDAAAMPETAKQIALVIGLVLLVVMGLAIVTILYGAGAPA